ncbi:MAG: hypothetical protein K6G08_01925 [Prevotella sp.]|nr:hypothetical protein [Prevotella sp.]
MKHLFFTVYSLLFTFHFSLLCLLCCFSLATQAQTDTPQERALWASINGAKNASLGDYQQHTGKVLVSWRMLPDDDVDTGFDLYRAIGTAAERKIASDIKNRTCYQDTGASTSADNVYRLTYAGSTQTLATFTLTKERVTGGLPYITIALKDTKDVSTYSDIVYQANDCSVGDLDGDGSPEVVVKRLLTILNSDGTVLSDGTGGGDSDTRARHCVVWDAYKLDGTFLWRVKSGPNIILGNSSNFAVADLDGDGCAEVVTKTGEGTIFGDGYEIPDTDGDGITDYRSIWPAGHYIGDGPKGYGGPEFFSVIDGRTGRELARAPFIARGPEGQTPAEWAANWYQNDWTWDPREKKYQWKLANSFRLAVASFDGVKNQLFLGRGVYGKTIAEGWDYSVNNGTPQLTRLWHFDTDTPGGSDINKDGQPNSAYASQGNHSLNVADLDGDGCDEVMYGSCAFDDDGTGLWTTRLGHGDANHVGKFLPQRDGLQVFHCLETGKTMVALHDARDGSVIWQKDAANDNDMGRCMVADLFPQYAGCEFFYYQSNYILQDGTETTISSKGQKGGCSMGIWFDGSLSRQLIEDNIIQSMVGGRTFTMYRYDESFNNGTKSNPGWYGDLLGDWREEVIVPDQTKLKDIKVFATWYPTTHKFPWLFTDHTYHMSALNQNVGYNQPTNLGYYLGTDLTSDAEAWQAAASLRQQSTAIQPLPTIVQTDDAWYNLHGMKVQTPTHGLYIHRGKLVIMRNEK